MSRPFLADARARYVAANAATLRWMLARGRLAGVFLDTKLDPVRLVDRAVDDVWRGPATIYGWIQGRGLEALVRHADAFEGHDPALAAALRAAARPLATALRAMIGARGGRAAFACDQTLAPVRPGADGLPIAQTLSPAIATYTDIFVRKGLVAASAAFEPARLDGDLAALDAIEADIAAGRFQMDERAPIGDAAPPGDRAHYGPPMILLGAGGLLRHVGQAARAVALARRLIPPVLERHLAPNGLMRDAVGGDASNPGHAIEFVGFAFEALGDAMEPELAATLARILEASFAAGFSGVGLRLSVSVATGAVIDPLMPWWSLPETIRAAALVHAHTGSTTALDIWRAADDAFFTRYWRGDPPIAFQTRREDGPIDHVPATPDLDPGYHTGLSLLGAIEAIERLA